MRAIQSADLLKRSAQKNIGDDLEIIIVDSGSTDATVNIVKAHNVKLISIKKEEFSYSYSLNLGIERSRGDIIVILSGHAIPCDDTWLEKMLSHFEDNKVAGVYCRQIPWPHADLHEVVRLKKTFGPISEIFDSAGSTANMHFSNAASCIRRSVWKRYPFVEMPAAEDSHWANFVVINRYKIVYDAVASVYHSHTEPCRKAARRVIELEKSADIINHRQRTILLTAKQSVGWFVRDIKEIAKANAGIYQKFKHLMRSVKKCFWYALDFDRI